MFVLLVSCSDTVKEYYPSGELMLEYKLKDDKVHGEVKKYYQSGQLKSVSYYEEDELEGPKTVYYENGNIYWEVVFKNGLEFGVFKEYNENGKLKISSEYKNGVQDGLTKSYHSNGKLEIRHMYKNGLGQGEFVQYYADGKLLMDAIQEKDETVYYKEYNLQGKMIDEYQHIAIKPNKDTVEIGEKINAEIIIYGPNIGNMNATWWFSKNFYDSSKAQENRINIKDNYYTFTFTPLDTGDFFLFAEILFKEKKELKSVYSKVYVKGR